MSPAPAPNDLITPITLAETAQLWWFCDGAIMDVGTRDHLHRSWGLCPRHSWLYFRAENELKYQPLGNAVLTEDLTRRAADLLDSHHRPHTKWQRLATADGCLTCDYLSTSPDGRDRFTKDMLAIQAGNRTRSWLTGYVDVWRHRRCPQCPNTATGDRSAPASDGGITCRVHLLAEPDAHHPGELSGYLHDLTERLVACVKSMTADGPDRTMDSDAALVEALGWLASWPPAEGWTAPRPR